MNAFSISYVRLNGLLSDGVGCSFWVCSGWIEELIRVSSGFNLSFVRLSVSIVFGLLG